jgi:hypothetical protein
VSGKGAYTITQHADGTCTRTGLWFHLTGPRGSVVLRDVGRLAVADDEIVRSRPERPSWPRSFGTQLDATAICGS